MRRNSPAFVFVVAAALLSGCTTLSISPESGASGWFSQRSKQPSSISPDLNKSFGSNDAKPDRSGLSSQPESTNPISRAGTAIAESRPVRGMKSAFRRAGSAVSGLFVRSAVPEAEDEISLTRRSPDPNAGFYIAAARLKVSSGPVEDAEKLYRSALDVDPGNLEASLELARLLDQSERPDEALALYRDAVRRHPDDPSAHNDMGLFLGRHKDFDGASQELAMAVKLAPDKKLYRNNLAAVLLAQGRSNEALAHLKAVHPPAVAHYNVGYMLSQSGDVRGGIEHIDLALQSNPSMVEAREYRQVLLARLPGPVGQHFLARQQRDRAEHEVARRPDTPVETVSAANPPTPH